MTFLELYKKWIENELLPENGLCLCVPDELIKTLDLFNPDYDEILDLTRENIACVYWGSGMSISSNDIKRRRGFTPLRQTIVLLCAALNGEFD